MVKRLTLYLQIKFEYQKIYKVLINRGMQNIYNSLFINEIGLKRGNKGGKK